MTAPAIAHRLHQIVLAIRLRTPPTVDPALFPDDGVQLLFRDLHPHDQRHLLEVHCKAQSAGLTDEVITAGLLHDIGKVTLTGARISLPARIAHVLLGRLAPQLRGSPTLARVPWLGVGLRLAERHAQYGAERLRALGVNESICRIVETHDLPNQNNPEMRALQAIDSATP